MNKPVSARRRARQRGSISGLMELALILLPFFAIFFAMIDFSIAVFLKGNFQHAVREGVRYAITYQTLTGQCQDASIKAVVKNNAIGFLNGTNENYIHVRYFNPAVSLSTEVTGLNSNNPGNIVEVSVESFDPTVFLWTVDRSDFGIDCARQGIPEPRLDGQRIRFGPDGWPASQHDQSALPVKEKHGRLCLTNKILDDADGAAAR
jgi:hypothetical protein